MNSRSIPECNVGVTGENVVACYAPSASLLWAGNDRELQRGLSQLIQGIFVLH
jgi:hypothetical protein